MGEPNEACHASRLDPANLAEGIGRPPDEILLGRQTATPSCWQSVADRAILPGLHPACRDTHALRVAMLPG